MAQEVSDATQPNGGIVERVRESARAQLSSQKDRATDGLGSVAQAVRQSTQQLRDQQHETIAQYVEQAADQIDRWSQKIRDKDVNDIVTDVQRLARSRPAVFIGSAFALGLVGARFLKSSSQSHGGYDSERYGAQGYGDWQAGSVAGGYGTGESGSTMSASTYVPSAGRAESLGRSSMQDSSTDDTASAVGESNTRTGGTSRRRSQTPRS